jgi:hypothetical protein
VLRCFGASVLRCFGASVLRCGVAASVMGIALLCTSAGDAAAQGFVCNAGVPSAAEIQRDYRVRPLTSVSVDENNGPIPTVYLRDQNGDPMPSTAFLQSILIAMDLWNHQSSGGTLHADVFDSSCAFLPDDYVDSPTCCDRHLVSIQAYCRGNANALNTGLCDVHPSGERRSWTRLCATKGDPDAPEVVVWHNTFQDDPAAGGDMVGGLAHEFGHALGLDHPVNPGEGGPYAIMSRVTNRPSPWRRALYPYDTQCVDEAWDASPSRDSGSTRRAVL